MAMPVPVMEIVAAVAAFGGGVVLARKLWPPPPPPARETMVALRQAGGDEVACTLDELRALLATAKLAGEVRDGALHVARGAERVRLVAPDPQRITLASLDVFAANCETLAYDAALALVARFGAVRLVEELFGAFAIDGTRDAAALAEERGERVRAMARAIADDMLAKQAAYANPGAS